jgi:superkiller protein 3
MSDKAADHGTRGERLAGEGKIDEAIEAFRQAVSIDPQFAAAYYNLGVLLRMQGQLDEAVGSYQKALVLTPDFAEAHYHLGNAL